MPLDVKVLSARRVVVLANPRARKTFRTDSQTVAGLQGGSRGQYEHLRGRVKLLLAGYPEWTLVLVERVRNKAADDLSRRPFKAEREAPQASGSRARSSKKNDRRRRG